jgi:hypothetical protein
MIFDRVSKPIADAVYEVIQEKLAEGIPLSSPVTSKSMSPLIKPGDKIEIHAASAENLKKDAIIALRIGDEIVAHRFIGRIVQNGAVKLLAKSDSALTADLPVSVNCLVGVVTRRERDKKPLQFSSPKGRLVGMLCRSRARIGVIAAHTKRIIQDLVLRTNHAAGISWVYRCCYAGVIRLLKLVLGRVRGVEAVWLRRSFALGDWAAGRSDLDLGVKIKSTAFAEDMDRAALVGRRYRLLKKLTPVCGELEVFTGDELALDCRYTARGREALNCKPIHGSAPELRSYAHHPLKCKLDALEEMLVSFIALGRVLKKEHRQTTLSLHSRRRITKLFSDVIKWIAALEYNLGCGCSIPMNAASLKECLGGRADGYLLKSTYALLESGGLSGLPQVFELYAELLNYLAGCTAILTEELKQVGITNVVVENVPRNKLFLPNSVCEAVSGIYPQLEFYIFSSPLSAANVEDCMAEAAKASSIPIFCTDNLLSLFTQYLPENAAAYWLQQHAQGELAKLLMGQQIAAILRSASRIAVAGRGSWSGNITEGSLLSVTVDSLVLILAVEHETTTQDREELLEAACRVYPEIADEASALYGMLNASGCSRTEASRVIRTRWLERIYPFLAVKLTSLAKGRT